MKEAFVRNAADKEQVKSAKTKAEFIRDRDLTDLKCILASLEGRRFIWRLLCLCGVFESSFRVHSDTETAFREGQRNIGLKLLSEINETDAESYLKMLRESKAEV